MDLGDWILLILLWAISIEITVFIVTWWDTRWWSDLLNNDREISRIIRGDHNEDEKTP